MKQPMLPNTDSASIELARARTLGAMHATARYTGAEHTAAPLWRHALAACQRAYSRAWWAEWRRLCREYGDAPTPRADGYSVPCEVIRG